jgi:hypothetical protein
MLYCHKQECQQQGLAVSRTTYPVYNLKTLRDDLPELYLVDVFDCDLKDSSIRSEKLNRMGELVNVWQEQPDPRELVPSYTLTLSLFKAAVRVHSVIHTTYGAGIAFVRAGRCERTCAALTSSVYTLLYTLHTATKPN